LVAINLSGVYQRFSASANYLITNLIFFVNNGINKAIVYLTIKKIIYLYIVEIATGNGFYTLHLLYYLFFFFASLLELFQYKKKTPVFTIIAGVVLLF
jgi:hypothetical protein